jgi:5'(3')-deoxyribonucleotidase
MNRTALIDVDGVLAAFTPHTLTCVGGRVKPSEIVTWEIRDYLDEKEKAELKKLWHDPDWWLAIPVLDGAREGVEHLREIGYEVVAITAPFHSCKDWEGVRRAWLKKHFDISHDHMMSVPGNKKARVHGDLLIDDKLETVEAWAHRWTSAANAYERAFLFDASYNQTPNGSATKLLRLMSWPSIRNHVKEESNR